MAEKIVLLKMADCANDEGAGIWMSVPKMANQCGCTDRHVQNVIKKYVAAGVLVVEGKPYKWEHKDRVMPTTLYRIDVERVNAIQGEPRSGVNEVRREGEPRSDKPSLEPSLKDSSLREDADRVPVDPAKPIYDFGKKLLGKYGLSAGKAGALLTKLLREHGPPAVMEALEAAAEQERHDIVAWIHGALRNENDEADTIDTEAVAERLRQHFGNPDDARLASVG